MKRKIAQSRKRPRTAAELRADDARRLKWKDPAYVHRVMESRRRTAASPGEFERKSQNMKRIWADSKTKKRRGRAISRGLLKPAVRKANSERGKRRWGNPELRRQASNFMKRLHASPEMRKRISAGTMKAFANPAVRKRIGDASRRSWANDPDRKRRHGELTRKRWAERRAELAAAWRPANWDRKPIEWRIIATELLSRDYMSNLELARLLDNSRIVTCPSSYGDSWRDALSHPGSAANFISDIRKWVGRAGKTLRTKSGVNHPRSH